MQNNLYGPEEMEILNSFRRGFWECYRQLDIAEQRMCAELGLPTVDLNTIVTSAGIILGAYCYYEIMM